MEIKTLLNLHLNHGQSFRSTFETLKNLTRLEGNIYFMRDRFCYYEHDTRGIVTAHMVVMKDNLPRYKYNFSEDCTTVGINVAEVSDILKNAKKKIGVHLHILENDPVLYLQIGGSGLLDGKSPYNPTFIRRVVNNYIEMRPYTRKDNEPNCTVPLGEVHEKFQNVVSSGGEKVVIHGYNGWLRLDEFRTGGIPGQVQYIGDPQIGQQQELGTCVISTETIKGMLHMKNMASDFAPVKFYLEPNLPLKVLTPISNCGFLVLYIQSLERQVFNGVH